MPRLNVITGGGTMGGYGARNEVSGEGGAANPDWSKLNSYVQSNGLACKIGRAHV